jgi:hypothetical protein
VQSADVLPAAAWEVVTNVAVVESNQVITIQDPTATNTSQRYYRLRIP